MVFFLLIIKMKNVIYINPVKYDKKLHKHVFDRTYVAAIYGFLKFRGRLPLMRIELELIDKKLIIGKSNDTNFYCVDED